MSTELYNYLRNTLGNKSSAVVRISEIEQLGGEDWLFEVTAQAEQLKMLIMPHPSDASLVVIERPQAGAAQV